MPASAAALPHKACRKPVDDLPEPETPVMTTSLFLAELHGNIFEDYSPGAPWIRSVLRMDSCCACFTLPPRDKPGSPPQLGLSFVSANGAENFPMRPFSPRATHRPIPNARGTIANARSNPKSSLKGHPVASPFPGSATRAAIGLPRAFSRYAFKTHQFLFERLALFREPFSKLT